MRNTICVGSFTEYISSFDSPFDTDEFYSKCSLFLSKVESELNKLNYTLKSENTDDRIILGCITKYDDMSDEKLKEKFFDCLNKFNNFCGIDNDSNISNLMSTYNQARIFIFNKLMNIYDVSAPDKLKIKQDIKREILDTIFPEGELFLDIDGKHSNLLISHGKGKHSVIPATQVDISGLIQL